MRITLLPADQTHALWQRPVVSAPKQGHGRPFTPAEDAYLCAEYSRRMIRDMAAQLGRNVQVVQQRIDRLIAEGRLNRADRCYHRPWTPAEDEYLADWWGMQPDTEVARHLRRSVDACKIRATRQHGLARKHQFWTARDVARLFGVDDHLVIRWIRDGYLAARKSSVGCSSGAMWEIQPEAIERFIKTHPWRYDPRRMEWGDYHRNLAERIHAADPWLSVAEAARLLDVSTACLVRHLERGWLTGERRYGAGGQGEWRIRRSVLATFRLRHPPTRGRRYRSVQQQGAA